MAISVLIVDDHAVLGKGLSMLLNAQEDMEVCGQAGTAKEALKMCQEKDPQVILLDLSLPDQQGHEIIPELKKCCDAKILALTMHEDEEYFKRVIQAGGDGYILKKAADDELTSAIRSVYQGEIIVDKAFTQVLIDFYKNQGKKSTRSDKQALSQREKQVLRLIALGHTNQEAADELFISIKTVETHIARIKEKIGLSRRSEMVHYAIKNNLIEEKE